MRSEPNGIAYNAEVDRIGCFCLADKTQSIETQRYHVLIGLLLSSQTKDCVTFNAMNNLKKKFDGMTIESIMNHPSMSVNVIQEIDNCIKNVGFHKKKSVYIYETTKILRNKYNNDIPKTLSDLMELPGIGPKMAYIAMQVVWHQTIGIGVDVHVHRITNMLGWTHKKLLKPEDTRKALQSWIPRELWPSINRLFVGFGQSVCFAKNPKCHLCEIKEYCPIGKKINVLPTKQKK